MHTGRYEAAIMRNTDKTEQYKVTFQDLLSLYFDCIFWQNTLGYMKP